MTVSLLATDPLMGPLSKQKTTDQRRPEMQLMTLESMKSMHYIPELDKKIVGYAVSWVVAIAMSTFGVVVYA
jgi:hypothetical protein